MDPDHFQLLIHKHLDDALSPDERLEFEQILLTSPEARTEFWKVAKQHAALRAWGQGRAGAALLKPRRSVKTRLWWTVGALAAAAAVLIASFGVTRIAPVPNELEHYMADGNEPEQVSRSVAILRASPGVTWDAGSTALAIGDGLQPGWLRLQKGAVQIEFALGARVVLEGPAEFQLVSSSEAFLKTGKLRAFVPEPAQGFRINSPDCLVVDYGTEFGFSVADSGASEVHVFEGKVEVLANHDSNRTEVLTDDQALKLDKGKVSPMAANKAAFLNEDEVGRRLTESERTGMERWKAGSEWLRHHADTLLYFDFEKTTEWSRTLSNQAVHGVKEVEASIVGCDWVDGRWRGKGALEFKRPEDRLRLSLPGQMFNCTFITWLRVDSLPQLQNSLLMGDSFQPGETHWFISRDGSIRLGMRNTRNQWVSYRSTPVITPEARGSWVMLATVYHGMEVNGSITVSNYVNGRNVGNITQAGPHCPMVLGDIEIGNWAVKPNEPQWAKRGYKSSNPTDHVRHLQGRIDELAVLRVSLTDADIVRLYDSGRVE